MAMNVAPLHCSRQGASSEPKKIYLDFSVLEKFAKNQKIHILGSHSKKWVQWPELLLYLKSTHPIQYLTAIWFESAQKNFGKKPCTPPFYLIFTSENHLNAHSSLIKPHMAMNVAPLHCSRQGASSEPKKIYLDFSVLEKFAKNQKIHILGSHSKKWVQWPELLLYLKSTHPIQYLTAIWFESAQKIFGKKICTPPFYLIFTSENHLNAHSSLIKPHMAMNVAPLHCSRQGASSEPKEIYLDFSVSEKFAKKQKIHIFSPTAKNGFNGRNFYYT
jgi:hypothetical protein